jgi:membrane protease YdiL (CAAX protease family)
LRIPVPLAWCLVLLTAFTAGLLRQFHDETPRSPYAPPVVGSLLFAACVFLLLVTVREWSRGAVPGPGVRLGSITPIMLMLLVEKWVSLSLYNPLFYWLVPAGASEKRLDAWFHVFAGAGLLVVCLVVSRFSLPSARKTWRRAEPRRWPRAVLEILIAVVAVYVLLALLARVLGGSFALKWPKPGSLFWWTLGGQALLAFAEEVYYRGLLLSEVERLAPRLGLKRAPGRRWTALLLTSAVFGMEHLRLGVPIDQVGRQLVFTIALGLILGVLVMLSANLHLAGALHAWINWMLLGAAPRFVDTSGRPVLPPGTYIGLALVSTLVVAFVMRRRRMGEL